MVVDSLVVGAGQAGLAMAWHLKRAGVSFRVVDASNQPGGSWSYYYDSLTLFSPAAYSSLPGLPFPGSADRYPHRDEVVAYLAQYAQRLDLPVERGQRVVHVVRTPNGFDATMATGEVIRARTLVAASGAFAHPHIPALPGLQDFQGQVLHSRDYRSPRHLEGQRVIVVGGANSAVQIAHELAEDRYVTLATRRNIRFVPQRLLGRDFHFWLRFTGLDYTRWLDDQSTPVLDDGRYRSALTTGRLQRRPLFTRILSNGVQWPDGTEAPVDALLFATGFRPNVSYLSALNPLDHNGRLRQRDGVSDATPGLYFMGFPKQRNFASATLRGVGPDAQHVAMHLAAHVRRGRESRAGFPQGRERHVK